MPRSKIVVLVVAVVTAAIVSYLAKDSLAPYTGPIAFSRTGARALKVETRAGTTRDVGAPPGKLLLLHFWATWCPPCVEELPGLLAYSREIAADGGIELLAVSVDDDWKIVDEWLQARGAGDLPVALDRKKATATRMGTRKFPETWVLSPAGDVLGHVMGPMDWASAEVRAQIDGWRKRGAPAVATPPAPPV
jgi:thiol-disulfide isomerase/thioredoxin